MSNMKQIRIKGAREHNLQDIDIDIPRDKFVVITGLSGSGKSSLAFDTMYAEGQRRYVESLSSYARMFLGQMSKPDLDSIDGLSPAVSIDQKTTSKNPRSTVGTTTEIYDYLRLLFARVGIPHCPECGRVIEAQTTDQVTDEILKLESDRAIILAPVVTGKKGEYTKFFQGLLKEGFSRVRIDGKITKLTGEEIRLNKQVKHFIEVVIDRVKIKEDARSRIAQAVELATKLSDGRVLVTDSNKDKTTSSGATGGFDENEHLYSLALACPEHGHSMDELQPRDFSFNAPYGSCPDCLGIGSREDVDPSLVIPDPSMSIMDGAVAPFTSGNYYPQVIPCVCKHLGADPYTPWEDLPKRVRDKIMYGIPGEDVKVDYITVDGRHTHWYIEWEGISGAVKHRMKKAKSDRQKEKYEKYMAKQACETCHGKRLKPEILAVTVGGKSIYDVTIMSAADCLDFFKDIEKYQKFTNAQHQIADPIIKEIKARLQFLVDVGLDYLTLERATATLSGGEAQRIRLATQIGAGLVGVLYILDEPSIGLHQRDNTRLINTLEHLRDLGNTVVVVEHDEETIRSADYVVDMGPGAGENGGYVVCAGTPKQIEKSTKSITGAYLSGKKEIVTPEARRKSNRKLTLTGATQHNLQNVTLEVPLSTFTVITGVSGSGKSSLISDTLSPALANRVNHAHRRCGEYEKLTGLGGIDKVINIDQSPIGRTPRSNAATYIGLWDDIRALYASTPDSKARGYAQGRFSFNVPGGRCEACKGDGQIKIEMHFLPDIYVPCEECAGTRYNRETLQVKYRGKNIADILAMTVEEALKFFENIPQIKRKLQTLYDVGLGYIHLGQPATTLSGGEAQRVKLASELQRVQTGKTFYILDEPTTGLHFEDVRQLLNVLNRLVDSGNTVLVIEHNLDVIKNADYIVDLGPEGGDGGGKIIASGTPEQVAKIKGSYTGEFLRKIL
ncbi:MAG: excinuclease ABC subunit UvrA [Coriobacteriia bacterium]|nr:excinuclease ABC subunit UvrA [Coriobacteriia bacterium]